ncbi:hypothetical protein HAX54_030164, partial [Datura stramonium]|nr:hypothetical protein [Datura stramonium]
VEVKIGSRVLGSVSGNGWIGIPSHCRDLIPELRLGSSTKSGTSWVLGSYENNIMFDEE